MNTITFFDSGAPVTAGTPALTWFRVPRSDAGTAAGALAAIGADPGRYATTDLTAGDAGDWSLAGGGPGTATVVVWNAPAPAETSPPAPVRFTLMPGTCAVWRGDYRVTTEEAVLSNPPPAPLAADGARVPADQIIVIDDFYTNPSAIRNWAISQAYKSTGAFGFPGWQGTKAMTSADIAKKIENAVGRPIAVDPRKYTFGGFRLITEDSGKFTSIHADGISDWAAMVYLTPDAPQSNGTGFFRHKKTGLSGPPTTAEALSRGYGSPGQLFEAAIKPERKDRDAWDLTHLVSPRFNRFIAFRGIGHYHAPLGGSGETTAAARLTHMFFFDEARLFAPSFATYATAN